MSTTIPDVWIQAIRRWAEGVPDVSAAWVYGSRARGTHRPDSDLDIAIETRGADSGDRLAVWMLRHGKWTALTLPDLPDGTAPPPLHLEWYDPENSKRVGPGVVRDGFCVFRR